MKTTLKPCPPAAALVALVIFLGSACTAPPSSPAANPAPPNTGPAPTANAGTPQSSEPSAAADMPEGASREVISCVMTTALVADPEPPLNVRSQPAVATGNIVGQLENGTYLTVAREQSGWLQISHPVVGWVAQNRVKSTCNQKVERIRLPQESGSISISDAFVGGGSHQYVLAANAGQTITLQGQPGLLPFITGPDNQPLIDLREWSESTTWTGQLPLTGDYSLTLDSNYKGYEYTFTVQIR